MRTIVNLLCILGCMLNAAAAVDAIVADNIWRGVAHIITVVVTFIIFIVFNVLEDYGK